MKFVKKLPERMTEDEFILVASPHTPPLIEIYDREGECDVITENVPTELEENEVVINHDMLTCSPEWINDFIHALGVSTRKIKFGPFGTETVVVKLRDDWRDFCYSWAEFYEGEES